MRPCAHCSLEVCTAWSVVPLSREEGEEEEDVKQRQLGTFRLNDLAASLRFRACSSYVDDFLSHTHHHQTMYSFQNHRELERVAWSRECFCSSLAAAAILCGHCACPRWSVRHSFHSLHRCSVVALRTLLMIEFLHSPSRMYQL